MRKYWHLCKGVGLVRIIQYGDNETLCLLKQQGAAEGVLRRMKYCVQLSVEEGVLLFNNITKELLLLEKERVEDFFLSSYAQEHWFAVPDQTDERQLIHMLRQKFYPGPTDTSLHKMLRYLIYTTTCCNARCPYCYEIGHHNNVTMTQETAEKTADFIMKRTAPEQAISLEWMGGEPLLNTKAIDAICKRIGNAGRPYSSVMATNGYLLNDEMIQKAKDLWRLKIVQITLDGLEEEYNATKRYTDKSAKTESPFRRVLSNIEKLLNAGIKVEIHLHITEQNGDDMLALIGYLFLRFGPRKDLKIDARTYLQRIFDDVNRREADAEKTILKKQIEALELIARYGYQKVALETKLKSVHCSPDANRQINILPDGKLGWCDEVIDRDFLGTVDSQELDVQMIEKYRQRMEDLPECADCPHYPSCIRLKCCFQDVPWCTLQYRQLKAYKLQKAILHVYKKSQRSAQK